MGPSERQPSSSTSVSLPRTVSTGFTTTRSSSSSWKTKRRRRMPTWVAARPTPSASCMTPIIRSVSRASSSSNASTSLARIRSTGSPYWRICDSATWRRARCSARSCLIVLVVVVVITVIVIVVVLVVVVVIAHAGGNLTAAARLTATAGRRRRPPSGPDAAGRARRRSSAEPAARERGAPASSRPAGPVAAPQPQQRSRAEQGRVDPARPSRTSRSICATPAASARTRRR